MKPKRPSFLSFPTLALAGVISLSASAMAQSTYSWNTTTGGTWDTRYGQLVWRGQHLGQQQHDA